MRRAILAAAGVALAGAAAAGSARADGPTGVELGLRTGYALPFGTATGAPSGVSAKSLSDSLNGIIPIWIDAGYRFNPSMYIGADLQYGIGLINNDKTTCGQSGASCSASDIMFGVDFHYHLMPGQTIDPWGGIGIGYEILNFSDGQTSTGLNGFQFVNLQAGADYMAMSNLGIGPFLMFSLGEFSNCSLSLPATSMLQPGNCKIDNQAMHEWLTLGVRGEYDVGL